MASTTIHTLKYQIVANTSRFTSGLVTTKKELTAAKRIMRSVETPLEKLQREVSGLDNLLRKGAITQGTYNRKLSQLRGKAKSGGQSVSSLTSLLGKHAIKFGVVGGVIAGVAIGYTTLKRTILGVTQAINEQFTVLDKLAKTASKLGSDPAGLQSLMDAVQRTSTMTGDQFATALQRMTRRMAEAANGTGEAKDALKDLGLNAQLLAQMRPEDAFLRVSDAFKDIGSQSERVRLAFKLFDTEGVNLVTTLQLGSGKIKAMGGDIEALGLTLKAADFKAIQGSNDLWIRFNRIIEATVQLIAAELAPIIKAIGSSFLESSNGALDLGGAIRSFGKIARDVMPPFVDMLHEVVALLEAAAGATLKMQAGLVKAGSLLGFIENDNSAGINNLGDQLLGDAADRFMKGLNGEFGDAFTRNLEQSFDRVAIKQGKLFTLPEIKIQPALVKTVDTAEKMSRRLAGIALPTSITANTQAAFKFIADQRQNQDARRREEERLKLARRADGHFEKMVDLLADPPESISFTEVTL